MCFCSRKCAIGASSVGRNEHRARGQELSPELFASGQSPPALLPLRVEEGEVSEPVLRQLVLTDLNLTRTR